MTTKCAVCGRELKSPSSIATGVGPVCAGKVNKKRRRQPAFFARQTSEHGADEIKRDRSMDRLSLANGEPMSKEEALALIQNVVEGRV